MANQADDGEELDELAYAIADEAAMASLDCHLFQYHGCRYDVPETKWLMIESVSPIARKPIERDVRYLELRGMLKHHPERADLVTLIERNTAGVRTTMRVPAFDEPGPREEPEISESVVRAAKPRRKSGG